MTTTKNLLGEYMNGNCAVRLYDDGTKIREYDGAAAPSFPESIDLKITDFCDAGCPFCHEKSTKRGFHADMHSIMQAVEGLPRGAEIAIGGGNPMSHPLLWDILDEFKSRGLIANITIHKEHYIESYVELLDFQEDGLIHGIGLSVSDFSMDTTNMFAKMRASQYLNVDEKNVPDLKNIVYHVIMGIANPFDLVRYQEDWRVLVLGYKRYGFGAKCDEEKIDRGIRHWRYWIRKILEGKPSVSFDNLAIQQLNLKNVLDEETWNRHYMGDDGQFTMYVDAVRNEYAISSTSPRIAVGKKSIREMFASLKGE